MPARTLDVALWDYRDHDGRTRRAFYGQTIELPEDEEQRGQRAGVFVPTPMASPDHDGSTEVVIVADNDGTLRVGLADLPAKSAAIAVWRTFAEQIGLDPKHIEALTKAQLITAITERVHDTIADELGCLVSDCSATACVER